MRAYNDEQRMWHLVGLPWVRVEIGADGFARAQGTEAGTAETEGLGPKDDGPVPEGNAS